MQGPLISVVLPTYSRADLLPGAVQSIINQSYNNWELIIVDDCSIDETAAVITGLELRDKRIRGVRNQTNLRLPASLNEGFRVSKGEFLTWTSDDNLYKPNAFAKLIQEFVDVPEADFIYSDMRFIDDEGNETAYQEVGEPNELIPHNPIGACFMYRRRVYEELGDYALDLFLAEDFDYWIRVKKKFTMHALHEDLYFYRYHARSLTSQRLDQVKIAAQNVILKHFDSATWLDSKTRFEFMRIALDIAYRDRDFKSLKKFLPEVARKKPFVALRGYKRGLIALIKGEKWFKAQR